MGCRPSLWDQSSSDLDKDSWKAQVTSLGTQRAHSNIPAQTCPQLGTLGSLACRPLWAGASEQTQGQRRAWWASGGLRFLERMGSPQAGAWSGPAYATAPTSLPCARHGDYGHPLQGQARPLTHCVTGGTWANPQPCHVTGLHCHFTRYSKV